MKARVGGWRGSADRTGLPLNSLLTRNFTGKSQNQANNSLPETTGKNHWNRQISGPGRKIPPWESASEEPHAEVEAIAQANHGRQKTDSTKESNQLQTVELPG